MCCGCQYQECQMTKDYGTPHFNCPDLRNAVVLLAVLLEWCDSNTSASDVYDHNKGGCTIFQLSWWKNAMGPSMTQLASYDTDVNISGMTWLKKTCWTLVQMSNHMEGSNAIDDDVCIMWCGCQHQEGQMTKDYGTPHFNCPDLRNVVVLLAVLLEWCDSNTSASDVYDHNKGGCTIFQLSWWKNAMGPSMTQLASYDTDVNISGMTWLKKTCWTLVQMSNHMEGSNAIDDDVCIMWCGCQHQEGHKTKMLCAPDFNCLGLRNVVVLLATLFEWRDTNTSANDVYD